MAEDHKWRSSQTLGLSRLRRSAVALTFSSNCNDLLGNLSLYDARIY